MQLWHLTAITVSGILRQQNGQYERRCEVTDPKKRADCWNAKYSVERVRDTLNDLRGDMAASHEAAIARVYATEVKVK